MTAAEKRAELRALLNEMGSASLRNKAIYAIADLLAFTDDEPAAPADWRDQAVALGTGWEKSDEDMKLCVTGGTFKVNPGGRLWVNGCVLADFNNAPLARCIAIDKFLADLGVGA